MRLRTLLLPSLLALLPLTTGLVPACVHDESLGLDGSRIGAETGADSDADSSGGDADAQAEVDGETLLTCAEDRLPTDGTVCDPSLMPKFTYCRLKSCAWGTEAECACVDGRWRCTMSSRDDYGCGAPPFCREKTSPTCDGECGEGLVRILAQGPWDEASKCWPSSVHDFGCVPGPDAGAAFSCFVRVSTGEYFLRGDTQLPSGSDYKSVTCPDITAMCAPDGGAG